MNDASRAKKNGKWKRTNMEEGKHAILLRTIVARCEFSNTARNRSLQRDRTEARFSERLPIGPPWRLRGWVSLILVGAPEDKQSSVLCYWRGAEPAKAFMKASMLSHSYSPSSHPIASCSFHLLLSPSFLLSISYTCVTSISFLSLFLSVLHFGMQTFFLLFFSFPLWHPSVIAQSRIRIEKRAGKPLYNLDHNSRKSFVSLEDFTRSHRLVHRLLTVPVIHRM